MARNPSQPPPSGAVGMPRIEAGMNQLPPKGMRIGGKGEKTKALGSEPTKMDKLLGRMRKRFDRCINAEADNRKAMLDDRKFKNGQQWPADVQAQRNFDKRPCLTINKMKTFVHQVTNDLRMNRPGIHVSPVGDRGDVEIAKMFAGLIRSIERHGADIAYDTGADDAATQGLGYWRVVTEYEAPGSFNQVVRIARVRNPFTIYLDPDHQDPTGADARYGFVTEMMPRD